MFTSHYPITTDYQNWLYMYTIFWNTYIQILIETKIKTNQVWPICTSDYGTNIFYVIDAIVFNFTIIWVSDCSFTPRRAVFHLPYIIWILLEYFWNQIQNLLLMRWCWYLFIFLVQDHMSWKCYQYIIGGCCVPLELYSIKDLHSRKDMNLARFNIDCGENKWHYP